MVGPINTGNQGPQEAGCTKVLMAIGLLL